MVVVGADVHKRTHTFVAVDQVGKQLGQLTVAATSKGHLKALGWARREFGEGLTWAIEGPAPGFFRTRDPGRADVVAAITQRVTAEVSRARDGSRLGLLRVMNLPGGKVLSACPQNC